MKVKKKLPVLSETVRSLTSLKGVSGGNDSSKRCELVLTATTSG